jgi:hypothetical protein
MPTMNWPPAARALVNAIDVFTPNSYTERVGCAGQAGSKMCRRYQKIGLHSPQIIPLISRSFFAHKRHPSDPSI